MATRRFPTADELRTAYDRLPYPHPTTARADHRWRIAPAAWLNALWRPESRQFAPRKVLVAGCGTGREAFAIQHRVPDAEVVGVDLSPRAIQIARAFQAGSAKYRRMRFMVADLGRRRSIGLAGGGFDFVSCHGVLSYVPDAQQVLDNLARLLSPDGALYLGVNGSTHHSVRWRAAIRALGLNPERWRDDRATRRVLRLLDGMAERTPFRHFARRPAAYLAGDLFGPPFRNLPLADWVAIGRRAGLHFRGSQTCGDSLSGLFAHNVIGMLKPRSRAEHHLLEELLMPAAFHRLLFAAAAAPAPPWTDAQALLDWRPVRLRVYTVHIPPTKRKAASPRRVTVKSPALNQLVELLLEDWEVELLRRADGAALCASCWAPASASRLAR
jgi:SAM-dependent methyltransferase